MNINFKKKRRLLLHNKVQWQILTANVCTVQVESRKAKYWGKCAEVLRLQCGMERSASDVKTKWANMKVRANKYQSRKNRTGSSLHPASFFGSQIHIEDLITNNIKDKVLNWYFICSIDVYYTFFFCWESRIVHLKWPRPVNAFITLISHMLFLVV